MGIPRFYRWLKDRYPLIRYDLTDSGRHKPIFDNFYIDFNAIVYQCIRESGCFLKNKIKPLTFERIYQRVIEYLLELVRVVNPQKLLFIAFDGVAPRAKINQSRDRRFRSSIEDIEFFEKLVENIGITTNENYETNSISPGTDFLFNLCNTLKAKIMTLMDTQWKSLDVFYSDCCVPGEGQHKIMDFLRYSKRGGLFSPTTTHCVYSPDADVILLTLTMNIENICVIKEDTTILPSMHWTATSTYRSSGIPKFELAFINILRQYLACEFEQELKVVAGSTIQQIIDDFVLLMAFIGNDFLPVEFCFTLKDNHMDALLNSYKHYLKQHQSFINNQGTIDWKRVVQLLEVAKRFEANRISEMKMHSRLKKQQAKEELSVFDEGTEREEEDRLSTEIQQFEVEDEKIVNGKQAYYQSRFGIQDIKHSIKFKHIIRNYIEGLEFYCQYYYKGLPSWSWFYPFHYTPLLSDVYEYLLSNEIKVELKKGQPYDPVLALMFMLPQSSFGLLPKAIKQTLTDPTCPLRNPLDFYPKQFQLDKFQTLKYNKKAMIQFLKEEDVVRVYSNIPKQKYSKEERERNARKNALFFYHQNDKFIGLQCTFNQKFLGELKNLISSKYDGQQTEGKMRFPTLKIFGDNLTLNQKGRVVSQQKYKYQGNPSELVFFSNFLGYVNRVEKASGAQKEEIEKEYQKRASIAGNCENYYIVKRAQYVREFNRHFIAATRKQVLVPDYALFKVPNFDYLPKVQPFEWKNMYQINERVIVLKGKYFGCAGNIVEVGDKFLKVRLSEDPIKCSAKIQQLDEPFYKIDYVLKELSLSRQTLFSILGEIIILPIVKRKQFNERLPTAFNFGLNFIDIQNAKIVPRFVRCDFAHENTKVPQVMFDFIEISKSGLKVLQEYTQIFFWLVEALEENRSSKYKKEFRVKNLFGKEQDPNLRLYKEFIKLYRLDTGGAFCSFYSKTADLNNVPSMHTEKKCENATITFSYHEVISRRLALLSPPSYKAEPEYHDIGSRVILLGGLQVGYVVSIDDLWIHVIIGKEKRRVKARFTELFNQSWQSFLSSDVGKCWNLQVSYYTPTYWQKAIGSD